MPLNTPTSSCLQVPTPGRRVLSSLRRAKTPPFNTQKALSIDDNAPDGGQQQSTGKAEIGPVSSHHIFPALGCEEALAKVRTWLDNKRPGPFLSIQCTPEVFATTANFLDSKGELPRMARDYDPETMTWHLRVHPHILHEVSATMMRGIELLVRPKLENSRFAKAAKDLVWTHASPTCSLSKDGRKEPDTALMMRGRSLPTVVFEVGYSQSRAKLRLDAKRWLETGRAADGRLKRMRGDEGCRPVMLVVIISFEGQRPSDAHEVDYTEEDYELPGNTKPLNIFVEMWRLMPDQERHTTRAVSESGTFLPKMCERKQFFPEVNPADTVTIYLTDLLGSDMIRDPENLVKYQVPMTVFLNAYEERRSMFGKEESWAENESWFVVTEGDVNKEDVSGGVRG